MAGERMVALLTRRMTQMGEREALDSRLLLQAGGRGFDSGWLRYPEPGVGLRAAHGALGPAFHLDPNAC